MQRSIDCQLYYWFLVIEKLRTQNMSKNWLGERDYYRALARKLDTKLKNLGHVAPGPCVGFYRSVKHHQWKL